MMVVKRCPCCHQTLKSERLGLPMPPVKAAIFDEIKNSGWVGISSRSIIAQVWPDEKPGIANVRNHVAQLNDMLEETNFVIACEGRGDKALWTLTRRA